MNSYIGGNNEKARYDQPFTNQNLPAVDLFNHLHHGKCQWCHPGKGGGTAIRTSQE